MDDIRDIIYSEILGRIESGRYKAGSRLPTEREFASEFKTTLWSVHSAMNRLEEAGIIERRRSLGTFIAKGIAPEELRKHRNRNSRTVTCIAARDFYYSRFGYEDIIGDMERSLCARGWNLTYEDMPPGGEPLKRFLGKCADAGIGDIVIFPERKEWETIGKHCMDFLKYPGNIYYYNRGLGPDDELPFNSVSISMIHSGRLAAEWVLEKGTARNIYLSLSDTESYWKKERFAGIKGVFSEHGKPLSSVFKERIEQLFAPAEEFIRSSEEPPALIVCNDETAAPVYEALENEGLKAGIDYFMVSFDNHPHYRRLNMASVAWPLDKIGDIFSRLIESRASSSGKVYDGTAAKIQVHPYITDRTSSPPLPVPQA